MASALDVSLDDLIKQRKAERKSSGAPRGGGRGGRGGRGATRGGGVGRGERGPKAGGERPARGSGNGAPEGASKIRVEGIVSSVTQEDLKELFGQVGPVLKVTLTHGTAHVTFARGGDAVKAKKRYDRVTLDGRPMSIEVLTTKPAPETTRQKEGRKNQEAARGGQRPARGGGGRGGRGRGAKREQAPSKSQEELDAELDAYLTSGAEPIVTDA